MLMLWLQQQGPAKKKSIQPFDQQRINYLLETGFFEGQKQAMRNVWGIKIQGDSAVWNDRGPWGNGAKPIYQPTRLDWIRQ